MYIKVKNPERSALLIQLGVLFLFLTLLLTVIIAFTLVSGSIIAVWQGAVEFFNYIKQEESIFTAGFCVFGVLMIPVGIIAGFIEWWKKRRLWNNPAAVYALDFGPDGVTVYTRQHTHFLPYGEIHLRVKGELVTVRTKNGSHAALHALTLTFTQAENSFVVRHKPTLNFLYRLADLHPYFKQLSFDFVPSSNDEDQKELASFLKEQIENQRRFGLHRQYRSYLILAVCGVLFIALGTGALCLVITLGVSPRIFMGWVSLLLGLGILAGGISLICGIVKDRRIARKLKQLRNDASN